MAERVAAVDCGTNSTRLLVAEVDDHGRIATLDRRMAITRLGAGVDATGRLEPDAIGRTVEVLRGYRALMDDACVSAVRVAATAAARDAENRDDFLDLAQEAVGARPELLSGEEEAELSFAGATAELDADDGPFLVVDIGGGSTELVHGTTRPEASVSLDIGCVRVTEKYLHGDPPRPEELSAALSVIELHLTDAVRLMPAMPEARRLVGLAGTVTTAAAVELGLPVYDRDRIHHFELTKEAAEDVFRTLATESLEDRRWNPGLDPARADVIVGGMCILVQLLRQLRFGSCVVSEADILDGLAASAVPAAGPGSPAGGGN